jgi:hypothetical protein
MIVDCPSSSQFLNSKIGIGTPGIVFCAKTKNSFFHFFPQENYPYIPYRYRYRYRYRTDGRRNATLGELIFREFRGYFLVVNFAKNDGKLIMYASSRIHFFKVFYFENLFVK